MTSKKFFHPDQLTAIRAGCDWRKLLDDLGVRADVKRCTATEFWGFSPFNPNEKTASFHMKVPGIWYDWSSHACAPGRTRPGGGVIELVQAIHAVRGEVLKLNEAASWIVDQGLTSLDAPTSLSKSASGEKEKQNLPIEIDLAPKLIEQGTHPAFVLRGISKATCQYLRCGFYRGKRGALKDRLVFQVGGVQNGKRVILSHIGRATTPDQEAKGKWRYYRGFNPSLELYNLDNLLLDKSIDTRAVILVEGAFDVAKCVEAGLKNVVATFGASLSDAQADKLAELANAKILVFYDRDQAGQKASTDALAKLAELNIQASSFDWEQQFNSRKENALARFRKHRFQGQHKTIAETIQDPCDFSVAQLRWLRGQGLI